jgi:GDPmannose 4,6-dehydratase
MWLMLQQEKPADYVIATGECHTIRDLLDAAFEAVDLEWRDFVIRDKSFMRPAEVELLVGDASRARRDLGWAPSVTFRQMMRMMVDADLELLGAPATAALAAAR